jgi:SPP1 gp7 family putative phage head morphogenesis protein
MHDWDEFGEKISKLPERYYALSHNEKLLAFSYANAAGLKQIMHVQLQLESVYKQGGTFIDFRKLVKDGELSLDLPMYRLENIFRTNIMSAYGRGSYIEQAESKEAFPYGKYVAIKNSAVRETHLALDGMIVSVGSDEYNKIYPPNGYNCRCDMLALTKAQAERERRYSDEATKAIIAANPPDKGFECPPFVGVLPKDLKDKREIKTEELMKLIDAGETISDEKMLKALVELENLKGHDKIIQTGEIFNRLPKSVVENYKENVNIKLEKLKQNLAANELKGQKNKILSEKGQIIEDELKKIVSKDINNALKDAGLISKATDIEKKKLIESTMRAMIKGMEIEQTQESLWNDYVECINKCDKILGNLVNKEDYVIYSAEAMQYFSLEERMLLTFYTKGV